MTFIIILSVLFILVCCSYGWLKEKCPVGDDSQIFYWAGLFIVGWLLVYSIKEYNQKMEDIRMFKQEHKDVIVIDN